MAVDPSGNIWVADSGHDRVLEFNSKHEYLRQFGSEGTGEGQFKGIGGIATNASGDVYVIDTANHRMQEFSPTGTYITQFGSRPGNGQFVDPTHRARRKRQRLGAHASSGRRPDRRSSPPPANTCASSAPRAAAPGSSGAAFGLAFSGGHLYVAELSRVQEFSTAGTYDQGSSMKQARATANPRCRGASPQTRKRATSTSQKSATTACRSSAPPGLHRHVRLRRLRRGQFSGPQGLAVSSSGKFFVADTRQQPDRGMAGDPIGGSLLSTRARTWRPRSSSRATMEA